MMYRAVIASVLAIVAGIATAKGYHPPKARPYHAPKLSVPSTSPVHVSGYMRSNGTFVTPSYRTAPNATKADNWSSKPNVNPYTGQPGTKDPYKPRGH